MNYLEKALIELTSKGCYFTPKEVVRKININSIIENPPYDTNNE